MQNVVVEYFHSFPYPMLAIFIISMLPIFELRLGLIAAAIFNIPLPQAFLICILGNVLPIPFILLFLKTILDFMSKIKLTKPIVDWLERKAKAKTEKGVKNQMLFLFLFVAIPLPGTGAWTGSLVATFLEIPFKKAFVAIFAGIIGAGVIMSVVSYFIPGFFGF